MTDNPVATRLHKPGVAGSSPAAAISYEPAAEYHGWPEVSATQLKELAASSLGYYRRFVQKSAPAKESPALRYGSLLHSWAELGRDSFWRRAVVAPDSVVTAAGQFGKSAEAWLADQPPDAIPLSPADAEKLRLQTEEILSNPKAVELLEGSDEKTREFNIRFSWDGHSCRCRVDGATPDTFYDLKTTSDKDPATQFVYSARDWKYDLQAAFYQRAAVQAGWPKHRMHFIATSNIYPHHCAVMVLPDVAIRNAEVRISQLLKELELRKSLDWWAPRDYGQVIEMPAHVFTKGRAW